ncbi:hypothetical protein [Novosphingobium sp.]|uniref:hypothetical protein n=1 Tax=Novosphingobium sp. TaxID=1874826 RepID=UPI003D13E1F7
MTPAIKRQEARRSDIAEIRLVAKSVIHPNAIPVILHDTDYDAWLTADWQDTQQRRRVE